jgi:hypothetical protein
MKRQFGFLRLIFCASVIAATGAAHAETTTSRNLDCSAISLKAAAQTGQSWFYDMSGICNLVDHTVTETATSTTSRNDVVSAGFANVSARWDAQTGMASESISFEGEFYGTINAIFQCNANPFETRQSCAVTGFEFSDPSLGYVAQYITQLRTPLSGAKVDPVEAAALAQAGTPPPPPPPPPAGTQNIPIIAGVIFRDPIVLEGEDLTHTVRGQGQASPQDMSGFGPGWSNNAHLFWAPNGVGSLLTIPLDASGPSPYSIAVSLTRAPDFAQVRAYIRYSVAGGHRDTNPVDIDAFAANVSRPLPITINVPQTTGDMQLVIITMGKNDASTGLFSGIDRIQIRRTPQ